MHLAEPLTMATDYVLAGLGGWLGWRLWVRGRGDDPLRSWAAGFWAMALAALLGGSAHGFAPVLGVMARAAMWGGTMVALGAAAVLVVYAAVRTVATGPGTSWGMSTAWAWLLAVEFGLYSIWVCWISSDFVYAVLQYGTALVVVLVIHLMLAARRRPGALSVVAGVLISFLAAWIQQAGIAPHPKFNHNDLYHVVQMVGLVVLYSGVVRTAATQSDQPT